MRVKILGKYWDLQFIGKQYFHKSDAGFIDPPEKKNKRIGILKTIRGKRKLRVIIHECLHGGDWNLSEDFVDDFSTDLSEILWKLGYRNGEEK